MDYNTRYDIILFDESKNIEQQISNIEWEYNKLSKEYNDAIAYKNSQHDYYENENNDGNIGISIWNTTDNPFVIEVGDRVCQGSFYKYLTVDNDKPITDKRTGGLGHSGVK